MTKIILSNKGEIMKNLDDTKNGEHNLLIYHDLSAFAEIYTRYAKERLKQENDLIVIFTCYETPEKVRRNLSEAGIDVSSCEKKNLLTIIDSMRVYWNPTESVPMFFRKALDYVTHAGKKGIVVFGDMSSFVVSDRVDEMLRYESLNPPSFEESDKIKAFCALHRADFRKLMPTQQDLLINQHKNILAFTL